MLFLQGISPLISFPYALARALPFASTCLRSVRFIILHIWHLKSRSTVYISLFFLFLSRRWYLMTFFRNSSLHNEDFRVSRFFLAQRTKEEKCYCTFTLIRQYSLLFFHPLRSSLFLSRWQTLRPDLQFFITCFLQFFVSCFLLLISFLLKSYVWSKLKT